MPAPRPVVREYALFGESGHLPDLLHCETIAERSALHGWELAPHRHARLHQLLLVQAGRGTAQLDGQVWPLAPMSLVNVAQGDVHAFDFEAGTQGWVVTLSEELVQEIVAPAPEARVGLGHSCVVTGDEEFARLLASLWAAFAGRGRTRALLLRGLATTLLAHVARLADTSPTPGAASPGHRLVQRLEALLDQHFLHRWGVADYARALSVSPTHLSRVAREVTGQPASRLIQGRSLREARRYLAYTSLRIGVIADALGFGDAAHFSRVFTRDAGLSPRAFRARLGHVKIGVARTGHAGPRPAG